MMIRKLKITNMVNIGALTIEAGQINKLTGKNGAGKSTVMDMVEFLVTGGIDPAMITTDEKKGEVFVEFTDGAQATRGVTAAGPRPPKTGGTAPAGKTPAEFLADLIAGRLLKPVEFVRRAKSKAKGDQRAFRNDLYAMIPLRVDAEILKQNEIPADYMVVLDYDQHGLEVVEQLRLEIYARRRTMHTAGDEKEKAARDAEKAIPADFDVEAHRGASAAELSEELATAREENRQIISDQHERENIGDATQQLRDRLDAIDEEIKRLADERDTLTPRYNSGVKQLADATLKLKDRTEIFTGHIEEKIATHDQNQKLVALSDRAVALRTEANDLNAKRETMTTLHDRVRDELPQALMADVPMPIPGLRFEEGEPYIDKVPMRLKSKGELFPIACGAAVESGKQRGAGLDVVLIDDFESLDEDMREIVMETMEQNPQIQWWYATVGTGDLQIESTGAVT